MSIDESIAWRTTLELLAAAALGSSAVRDTKRRPPEAATRPVDERETRPRRDTPVTRARRRR
jgi:hypothetical protein